MRESLQRVILNEVARFESRPAPDWEIEAQNNFAADRSRHFVGRAAVMSAIDDYVRSDDRRPLVIHGASGSGKSAIMAKTSGAEGAVRRFIGATPESSNGLTLLRNLCQEIARRYGQPEDVPATFNELAVTFADRIKLATRERPLLLFLDALDQLGPQDPAAAANWLPVQLPPHCKVVVSTIEAPAVLQRTRLIVVEPFSADEADQALALWFEEVQRTLQKEQREKLLASFRRSPLPLYLKLAFEEARWWKSFNPIEHCVLGEGIEEIIDRFFSRLSGESNHGPVLVSRALGYLTAARYGLTEDEILAVLSNDDEVWKDFKSRAKHEPPERRLPVIVWSRFYLDLEPYLTERAAPGGTVISFYHRQLVERVPRSSFHHSALAGYFAGQSLWLGTQRPNQRKVTELVRQQVKAELLDDAVGTLTDIEHLEAKCAADLVFDLQEDYHEVMMALPEAQAEMGEEERRQSELTRWTQDLTEYARQWSQWRDQQARSGLFARLIGRIHREPEPRFPRVVRCIESWADERIAAECRRIVERPARLDRLGAFAGFVERELYPLVEFGKRPGFVVQHGFNSAPAGPVYQAASRRVDSVAALMLQRLWAAHESYNPKPALSRSLQGHKSWVSSVAVTLDGRRAVSVGFDQILRVWDLDSGACLRALQGHTLPLTSVSVTPDGRWAVSGSRDRTLRVWDLESGTCLRTLQGQTQEIWSVSVTPDGRRAVSAGGDGMLQVWDLESGTCLRVLQGHTDGVWSVVVTPDGRRAVSAGGDGMLRVWDLVFGKCIRTLQSNMKSFSGVGVALDGRRAVSACTDEMLRVWDMESGICQRALQGHTDPHGQVSVTPDGRRAVSGGHKHTLQVWDLESGVCLRTLHGHADRVSSISFAPDARRAVSASHDGMLRVWDLESGTCQRTQQRHTGGVPSISVTPDGRLAVSAGSDPTLRVWDLESGACLRVLDGHSDNVLSVSMMPDGRRALSTGDDGTLRVWDMESGACLRVLDGDASRIQVVSVTPDGSRAVSATSGGELRVWELESGAWRTLRVSSHHVQSVSISSDGRRVLSGGLLDGALWEWDLESFGYLRALQGHTAGVRSIRVTPDGRCAVSGSQDNTLRVWDLRSGTCLRTLRGHTDWVNSVSVTLDGSRVVSGSSDRTLRVWDLESGTCLAIARLDAACMAAIATSERRIIAGTSTGEVLIFVVRGMLS